MAEVLPPSAAALDTRREARSGAQAYLSERLAAGGAGAAPAFRSIPIIDLAATFGGGPAARQAVAAQMHAACTTSGFFYIVNHGIAAATCDGMLAQAARFFRDLAPAQKQALHVGRSSIFRGWEPADYSVVNPDAKGVAETKEGFNWGYEEGLDPAGGDGRYTELHGTRNEGNQWPADADLPGFYAGVREYYGGCLQLARHLFGLFALSLQLPEDHFDALTTHPGGIARLLRYPPGRDLSDAEEVGLGAHTDYECFTLLLQSPDTSGLEVLSPDGAWVAVEPVPGGLVVNVADFLMRWTNGVYKSTVHRVVNRTPRERFSVPFFFSINYDATVETLPSCVSEESPARFKPIKAGEYILERLRATTDGY